MFRTLYVKLVGAQAMVFFVIGIAVILATERIAEGPRLVELVTDLVIGAVVFSLVAALLVFHLLTRRLRALASAVESFRVGGFTESIRFATANAAGDDIDRLGAAVQEMSERIAGQLQLLERTQMQRRELLANVSHDLRTPLASMQGYLETLLLKHGAMTPDEARGYIEIAARHSERLGNLIGDLFQLTKLEAHEVTPHCETFPIDELVQDVLQKFELAAQRRGLRLVNPVKTEHVQVDADIGMIERVLENLVENAMRHTPAGGEIHVDVAADSRVRVRVADTGSGIPQHELATVFDRYYRVDRGGAKDAASTGLGLAITRHIVALHGGDIRVESTLGEGSVFSFDLPRHVAAAEPQAGAAV